MCRTERRMSPGKIEKEGKYSVEIAYFFRYNVIESSNLSGGKFT